MREILFRAKLKDWKSDPQKDKWVEGFYLKRKETTYCFTEDYEKFPVETLHYIAVDSMTDWGLPNEFRYFEIDPYTLCQYTGITDKNGNKIWENDIVSMKYVDCISDGVIKYREGNVRFVYHESGDGDYGIDDTCEIEVLGNIFDNPDKV